MDHFVPEDSVNSNGVHHKRIRQQGCRVCTQTDDDEFKKQEILAVLKKFNPSKAPGEDALNSNVLLHTYKSFPNFFTEICNECLRSGHFPKQWKHFIIIPIVKLGKEWCNEVNKCRPISLLNVGGKVLKKLLIESTTMYTLSPT
jgi:hypothetical protein